MTCQQAKPLIGAYADGELEASAILELDQHIQTCSACSAEFRNLQNLKKALKQDALYFNAPSALKQRIQSELPSPDIVPLHPAKRWNWLTPALGTALAACLVALLIIVQTRPSPDEELAQEVVASHVRSLMADHATDVVSTDQQTVKPWFNGKLDFSPPVKNLAEYGFPLIGGRLDYLSGRPVAALVYQRHKHFINLFVWPTSGSDSAPTSLSAHQGYNSLRWNQGEMTFWAVSDLNQQELTEFARDLVTPRK
ncbi:MAG: prtR [Verrucomicrobiales bacterium]|nr:prtR [Verrucomicrobiales bacterium]